MLPELLFAGDYLRFTGNYFTSFFHDFTFATSFFISSNN